MLDRERTGVAQADERPAAADELVEALEIICVELIGILGAYLAARSGAATAPVAAHACDRDPGIVGDHEDVDLVRERLPEVLGMSDRIYVMRHGRIQAELDAASASEERVLHAALGLAS